MQLELTDGEVKALYMLAMCGYTALGLDRKMAKIKNHPRLGAKADCDIVLKKVHDVYAPIFLQRKDTQ